MQLGVVASASSWYVRDLQRAAGSRHQITCVSFDQLVSRLDEAGGLRVLANGQDLACLDVLLVRTMPPGSLEQVVFRMDALGCYERAGGRVINPPRAVEAAVDKYLASSKLMTAGLKTPPTLVCQQPHDAMAGFEILGGDVVVKPVFGSEGRGLTRIADAALALRAFKMLTQLGAVIYLQPFIPHHGYDLRLLVLGDRVLSMRRSNPHDWRTNVSRGAETQRWDADSQLTEIARRAAAAVGAPFAGVDLLPGLDGQLYVLEVNAVPGWRALANTLNVDVASLLLDYLQSLASA